jgi:SsrA-binding protein
MWVKGMNISPYFYGSYSNHEAKRDRKLLLTKRELRHLEEANKIPGHTIIPILIFIDPNGRAKVDIALAKGKHQFDKRQTLKEKEDRREMDRARKHF